MARSTPPNISNDKVPKSKDGDTSDSKPRYKKERHGIYEVEREINPSWIHSMPLAKMCRAIYGIVPILPYIYRLVEDVFRLAPCSLVLLILAELVREAIDKRNTTQQQLFNVAMVKSAYILVAKGLGWVSLEVGEGLKRRLENTFEETDLKARLRLDLPTSEDPDVKRKFDATRRGAGRTVWATFQQLVGLASTFLDLISTATVLYAVLRERKESVMVASLALISPIASWYSRSRTRGGSWIATVVDPNYRRKEAIQSVAKDRKYRKDLVSLGLARYLLDQFLEASSNIPAGAERRPHTGGRISFFDIFPEICANLPDVLVALRAIQNPGDLPINYATYTLISRTASTFGNKLGSLYWTTQGMVENLNSIKWIYDCLNIELQIQDGTLDYLPPMSSPGRAGGMKVEFKEVSFSYPSKDTPALRDVNFTILPGQLCVIVGYNGAGKSTLIKLLNRLYDPMTGTVLVDDMPAAEYRTSSLRGAMSVASQQTRIFPFTLKENIGLGNHPEADNEKLIVEACELGGVDFAGEISEQGLETEMGSRHRGGTIIHGFGGGNRWRNEMDKRQERDIDLSGGQLQRVGLARAFMRRESSLLVVDEPSASLDPKSEYELFKRLERLREGRTAIYITHRFGAFIKSADMIIMMDSGGRVAEKGSHQQLMELNGKYKEPYTLQAQTFQ